MKAEQFIKEYSNHCSNELCAIEDKFGKKVISYREWLTPDQALRAVEIAREELIEKACEWLEEHLLNFWSQRITNTDYFIEDFKQAINK